MDEAKFSRSCARVVVGVWCRGEPPFKRYEGTAERGLGRKGGETLPEEGILGRFWLMVGRLLEDHGRCEVRGTSIGNQVG